MTNIRSYELLEFNIDGHINLDQKRGMIKIMRSDDGRIILAEDSDYGLIDQNNPTQTEIVDTYSMLGLVMDIGIKRTKQLTHSDGFYFGLPLVQSQSSKKISQKDFNSSLMEKIDSKIQKYFASGNASKEVQAIKYSNLIKTYNDARLLVTTFYNESYLAFLRILDSLSNGDGSYSLARLGASTSHDLNEKIFKKVSTIDTYSERIKIAEKTFKTCYADLDKISKGTGKNKEKRKIATQTLQLISSFSPADIFIFSCLYSAYQYRNVFVHEGFPFPELHGSNNGTGTAYLDPCAGQGIQKIIRPNDLQKEDIIDIHHVLKSPPKEKKFIEQYFLLLPTWLFLKEITRATLLKAIDDLV